MNTLTVIRTIILSIGWPVLIIGSIYLFIKGREVYGMVKGSLVGKITKALVWTMLIEMYSLGVVTTAYMFADITNGVLVGVPIFAVWFVVFVWSLRTLIKAKREVAKLNG